VGKSDVRTCEIPVMGMEGWALVNLKLIFVKFMPIFIKGDEDDIR